MCCTIQSASAAVRVTVPGEVPGIPAYAQFGYDPIIQASFILHDEQWTVIPFYRDPDCVPSDFNLIDFVDFTEDTDDGLNLSQNIPQLSAAFPGEQNRRRPCGRIFRKPKQTERANGLGKEQPIV